MMGRLRCWVGDAWALPNPLFWGLIATVLISGCGSNEDQLGSNVVDPFAPGEELREALREVDLERDFRTELEPIRALIRDEAYEQAVAELEPMFQEHSNHPSILREYGEAARGMVRARAERDGWNDPAVLEQFQQIVTRMKPMSALLTDRSDPSITPLLAQIHFDAARAQAAQAELEEALDLLIQANTFASLDLEALEELPEFADLRDLPRYRLFRETTGFSAEVRFQRDNQKLQREVIKEQIPAMIDNQISYPFDFDLVGLDGQRVALQDLRGKVVLVDIWGTWCEPCQKLVPELVQLYDKYQDRGFVVVGLTQEEGEPDDPEVLQGVRNFLSAYRVSYPVAMITPDIYEQVPGFEAYPTTIMIDRIGRVQISFTGGVPEEFLEEIVILLLDETVEELEREQAAEEAAREAAEADATADSPTPEGESEANPEGAEVADPTGGAEPETIDPATEPDESSSTDGSSDKPSTASDQ